MYLKQLVISSLIVISSLELSAQDTAANAGSDGAGSSGSQQPAGDAVSFHLGPYLPKNFSTVDEILKVVGARYSYAGGGNLFYEAGFSQTRTASNKYLDFSTSLRADIPLADFTAFGLGGLNLHRLKTPGSSDYTYYGGAHVGGGLLAHISGGSFLRLEMRLNLHPGTVMFFGLGLEVHFGSGGGGAE